MAIKRCPYCRAILAEEAEYRSNCGTQLLFPEDEHVEEEVPGDKIVDGEEEKAEAEAAEEKEEETMVEKEKGDVYEKNRNTYTVRCRENCVGVHLYVSEYGNEQRT